jgi:serine/threonine protein kinase
MINLKPSTTKVDMWALGVILYQFFSNKLLPFRAVIPIDLMNQIRDSKPAPLPSTVSPFIQELIAKLLDKKPENRPDA